MSNEPLTPSVSSANAGNNVEASELLNPERFSQIFNATQLGIAITSLSGYFVDANPAFCQLLGYTLQELTRLDIAAITHADDLPANMRLRQALSDGQDTSGIFEKRYIHKNGDTVWVRLVGSPIRDASGKVVSLFGVVENITERKQAEQELRKSEEQNRRLMAEISASEQRLRYITRASLDLIWDWNLTSNTIWWGEGLQSLFGFTAEMIGSDEKFWLCRAHRDDRRQMQWAFRQVMAGITDGWTLQLRIRRMDGSYAQVEERAFAVRDAAGNTVRIVGGVTDVSERLELEEQLRQSQRLEAIGKLTGGVAHDFNNLLTVMLGNAELLRDALIADPELLELTDAIVRSALQGADLTHRLLAFARKQALDPKAVDVNHLVENMGRILARTLGEETVLDLCPAPGLWLSLVDPNQLEAAILNLCLNARDAMPDGGKLTIETSNVTLGRDYTDHYHDLAAGDYVSMAISDTGIGIPPENLERVLEPFFTTKPRGKGTGLGLSTIFGFVKQSNGHLNIYSEVGQGTTVRIYLPRIHTNEIDITPPPRQPRAEQLKGSETILLVEDDDMVRQYASTMLASLGYRVLAAANGADALALLNQHSDIALLFTDVIMPGGIGGRQLAETARVLRPALKVLYTSGYTENSIVHNGRLDAGVHLLGKPYQRHELASKLRELLDQR